MKEDIPQGKVKIVSNFNTFIVDDRYQLIKSIGSSISAIDHKTNTKVYIQMLWTENWNEIKDDLKEIKLLKFFDHENIIKLLDIQLYPEKRYYKYLYTVNELMDIDLHKLIRSRQVLTNEHIKFFMYQLLKGVLYIHSSEVIHCDLSPGNILVNENCDLKICGFGVASRHGRKRKEWNGFAVRWYESPELALNCDVLTKKIDIWSCGCIFAELLGRQPLFPYESYNDYVEMITRLLGTPSQDEIIFFENPDVLSYFLGLPNKEKTSWSALFPNADVLALDLLDKMIRINPEKRWAAENCLAHPYLQDFHDINDESLAREKFNWNFENCESSIGAIKSLVYEEAVKFHHK